MAIGLKALTTTLVVIVVLIVGATCLSVTLITTTNTFNQLSQSWAQNIAEHIAVAVNDYYSRLEFSAASFVNSLKPGNWNHLPSDLAANYSKNWTDFLVPALMRFTAKSNYKLSITSVTHEDYWWMHTSRNSVRDPSLPETWFVEWIEVFNAPNVSVGGFQYMRANSSRIPYGPETNYTHAVLNSAAVTVDLYRRDPRFLYNALVSIAQSLFAKRRNESSPSSPPPVPMFWTPMYHSVRVNAPNVFWQSYLVAGVTSDNGTILGSFKNGLYIDRDIKEILDESPRSANSEAFLIDNDGFIIATTRSEPGWVPVAYDPQIRQYPPGCSTTATVEPTLFPRRAACRLSVETYSYFPLNAVGKDFATSTNSKKQFMVVSDDSGSRFAVSTQRITTKLANLKVNVVAVVPESDLGVDEFNRAVAIGIGCGIAVMCVMIGVALVALHFVTLELQSVREQLYGLATLSKLNDAKDDDGAMDDEVAAEQERDAVAKAFATSTQGQLNIIDFRSQPSAVAEETEQGETSWISEVANLQEAYKETARSMTNFTRYVSPAVVSELIISRGIMSKRAQLFSQNKRSTVMTRSEGSNTIIGEFASDSFIADENETCLQSYDDLTVLFVEIEGFSNIWRMTAPEYHAGVCMVLHIYFKRMCRLIMGHGGIVDRFLGDSIMSYWGAPVQTEYHAHFAVLCALALLRETTRDPLKKIFMNAFKKQLKLRGGLASGTALVGTIETRENLNYTILGTPVTHAKHLQSFNKAWKTSMLMDQNTAMKVGDMVHSRLLCNAAFQGEADIPLSKQQQQQHRAFTTEAGQHRTSANKIKIIRVYEVVGLDAESRLVGDRVVGQYRSQNRSSLMVLKKSNTSVHDEVPQLPGQVMTPSSEDEEQNWDSERVCTTKNCDSHDFSSDEQDVGTAPLSDLLSEATLQSRGMRELLGPFGQQLDAHNVTNNDNTMNKTNINNSNLLSETDARLHSDLRESMSNTTSQSLTRLLRWHFTRTNVESKVLIDFCHRFREAALLVIDQKFPEAKLSVAVIQNNPAFEELLKNSRAHRESIKQLLQTATTYCKKQPPRANISPDNNEFFFLVNYQ